MPITEMDENENRDFVSLKRSRSTQLAQLTKIYKDIERKMISVENIDMVKELYGKLCDRFEQFKSAHLQCLEVCSQAENVDNLEENYESNMKNFMEFKERFSQWIADSEKIPQMERTPDKSCTGSIASSRTSTSSRAKLCSAKAKRLVAEMKLKNLKVKLELENAQREIESKQRLLDHETQLQEAMIEESVWEGTYGEEDNIVGGNPQSTESDYILQNKCTVVPDEKLEQCQSSVSDGTNNQLNSAVNNNSAPILQPLPRSSDVSVDDAFQRLAATLQEGFNLPKPELLTFNGTPTSYLKFIKNFETNIESRVSDNQLRLSYLIQYCEGEAKESIEDCVLLEDEGYKRARTILHSRYGRPHIIARSYIDNLVYGPQIKASDINGLSRLSLEMQKCDISLSQLGFVSDVDNSENLRRIVKRLPMHMRTKWVEVAHSINESGREPRFSDLVKFVDEKARVANSMYGLDLSKDRNETKGSTVNKFKSVDRFKGKATTLSTQSDNGITKHTCNCCSGSCRDLACCNRFKSMNLNDRFSLVRRLKLCYICLKGKHFASSCRQSKVCSVSDCNAKHHVLLHCWVKSCNDNTATQSSVNCAATEDRVKNCLGIIPVIVKGGNGNSYQTYALLDDGADKTLCDERLLKALDTEGKPVTYHMSTVSSSDGLVHGKEVDLNIQAINTKDEINIKRVWSVKRLPVSTRSAAGKMDVKGLSYLAGIDIPEIRSKDVMLLIGTDAPGAHIPLEVRAGTSHQPYAIRTRLGWAVRGPVSSTSETEFRRVNVNFEKSSDVLLQRQLERMWTSDFNDTIGDKNCMSVEDKTALKLMEKSITHENGHYILGLPWRQPDTKLPNNLSLAHARLDQLKRKLSRDSTLHEMYTKTVNDYIEKGYAEEVTKIDSESSRIWYLPHHPVVNVNKPGKVRVVFDCAAKFQGMSLSRHL